NCTLTLRNDRGQFREGNAAGVFGASGIVKNSRVRLRAGVLGPDGTEESAYVFTGFVSAAPVYNPDERTAALTLYDHMAAFGDADAEQLSVLVEKQLLGQNAGTEFETSGPRAGLVLKVLRGAASSGAAAASELNPAEDYTVSGLNSLEEPAVITLSQELTSGEAAWATWRQWHASKEIHWVAGKLCDLAGVENRAISPVIFSTDVENSASYDTQGQWETGTRSNMDTASYPGALAVGRIALIGKTFAAWSGGLSSNWTTYAHGTRFDVRSGEHLTGEPSAWASSAQNTGTWDCELTGNYYVCPFFYFLASTGSCDTAQGYALGRSRDDGKWKLWRMNGASGTVIWNSGLGTSMASATLRARVARTAAGAFYVAIYNADTGALSAGSMTSPAASDTAYSSAGALITRYSLADSGGLACYGGISSIRYTPDTASGGGPYELSGTWTSQEIDGSAALKNWGMLSAAQNVPDGCSSAFQARQRPAQDQGWGAWVDVPSSGQLPLVQRYAQVRWNAAADLQQAATPLLYNLRVPFSTSNTAITMVNMTGLTAKSALDQLSRLCCYETGFDSQDTFLFRPRSTGVSASTSLGRNEIEKLSTLSDGSDRVYNRVVVSFGNYRAVADPDTAGEAAPTSRDRHGVRTLEVSSEQLLPAENVNLARALAPAIYAYTSRARRRAALDARLGLALELGDRVTVDYPQDDLFPLWRWGEDAYGREGLRYYSRTTLPGTLMLACVDMRVEGIELDLENWRARYDLTEVL
ncbi:MAG: hypothetical protein GX410_01090, partial [Elusimicrobia bacterium]|nr:hypothetical protein [Elusimicrobiota bacterium]